MTGSLYFKARLNALAAAGNDGPWQLPDQETSDGCLNLARFGAWVNRKFECGGWRRRALLVEYIGEGELELAHAILHSMYGWQSLPAALRASPLKLLRTLLLASRFQVGRCVALCLAALSKLALGAWGADAVALLLELPEEILRVGKPSSSEQLLQGGSGDIAPSEHLIRGGSGGSSSSEQPLPVGRGKPSSSEQLLRGGSGDLSTSEQLKALQHRVRNGIAERDGGTRPQQSR